MKNEKDLYKGLIPYINCIDYTVSKESYEVLLNPEYDMMVTLPVPLDLENYYKRDISSNLIKNQEKLTDFENTLILYLGIEFPFLNIKKI